MKKNIALLSAGLLVMMAGLAVASHVHTPPISDGGEFAYVRDYSEGALDLAAAGSTVTATYVSWSFDHDNETVEDWTSRGRMSDNVVFEEVNLPRPSISGGPAMFKAVQQYERGMVTTDQACGCLGLLNSVNAGLVFVAKQNVQLVFVTTDDYNVVNVSDERVELHRHGHVYAVEATGGSIAVDRNNLTVSLGAGGDVRSWIDGGAFPATTQAMHAEFDHLADQCLGVEPEPEPEKEPEKEPEPEQEPEKEPVETRSKGFWANHPEAWPVMELTLGNETYNQTELLELLPAGTGDASVNLATQLIAAKLNVAAGANDTAIADTIAAADDELAAFEGKLGYGVAPSSETGQRMLELKDVLDAFNNGEL